MNAKYRVSELYADADIVMEVYAFASGCYEQIIAKYYEFRITWGIRYSREDSAGV